MISFCFLKVFNFFPIKTADPMKDYCSVSISSVIFKKRNLSQSLIVNYYLKSSLSLKAWNTFRYLKGDFLICKIYDENKTCLVQVLENKSQEKLSKTESTQVHCQATSHSRKTVCESSFWWEKDVVALAGRPMTYLSVDSGQLPPQTNRWQL